MPYKAGSAYASVLPDFRGFHEKIGAEFAKIEPAAARAGEKSGTAWVKAFDERVRLARTAIRVDADTMAANAKIKEASRDRKVKLKVETQFLRSPLTLGLAGAAALGPSALGLGLAGAGLGVGAGAAGAGLLGFLAIAKPMFTAVTAAQKNLTAAQLAYNKAAENKKLATTKAQSLAASKAEAKALLAQKQALASLSPQERQLATELTGVQKAWKGIQLAEQPAVGRGLLPWLQTARRDLPLVKPLVTGVSNAVGLLGNEAQAALSSPFWSRFSKTFGATAEIGVQTFGESVGKVGDGLAHLFTTFAPDIDKLPVLVDKAAGAFDKWASSIHRGGLEAFFKKTFSHGNLATLKGDLSAFSSTLGHVASATSQLSPAAFLGLSKVLTILSKLTPDQITALGALYGVSKLTGGLPGSLLAKGAGAVGSAVLGSAIGQAVTNGLKTGLASVLSTIGLKGIAGKIAGSKATDILDTQELAGDFDAAITGLGIDFDAAITGLGLDIDAAVVGLGADIDAAIGASTTAIVGAIAVSKGVDVVGNLLSHLHIPGLSNLLGGSSTQTVNVKFKVPPVSFKSMAASFRRDVEGPVGAWFAGLAGQAAKAGAAAGAALAHGIGSQKKPAASAGTSIFGAVRDAFDPRALFGAGEKIVGSLISGAESKFGEVESVFHKLTSLIPTWKGPSAVDSTLLTPAGETIMQSLIKGLDKGWNSVRGTLRAVAPKIASELASAVKQADAQAARGGGFSGVLAQFVQSGIAQLGKLAYQYNQVEAKIAAARQFAATTAGNVTSSFGIIAAGAPGANGKTTIGSIQGNLSSYLHKIRAFGHNISLLGQRGLNKAYLRQLLSEGPDVAGPIAAALASATDAQLGQVNSAEFQISKTAGKLGKLGANLLFDSGPDFGKSFLSGLNSQKKQLKAIMRELAQVLVVTVEGGLKLPGVNMPASGGGLALQLLYDGPATGPIKAIMQDMRAVIIGTTGGDVQKALGRGKART